MAYTDGESRNAATEIAKSLDKRIPGEPPTMTGRDQLLGPIRELSDEERAEQERKLRLAAALEKWGKE